MIYNTFIFNPIRNDFIGRAIETLYQYTDMSQNRVIVVDQTKNGLKLPMDKVHMVIRPYRNLGFAKSLNEGIIHALRWGSEYISCFNDDVEWINKAWWQGIVDTFNMPSVKEILVVAPESPRLPLWGYGNTKGDYINVIPYERAITQEGYDYLMKGNFSDVKVDEKGNPKPKTFPDNYVGVCDGIAAWGPVFKRKFFDILGLWEERFYPGSGEDYDMLCRAYSKNYRMVSTRKSWCWHFWSKSVRPGEDLSNMAYPIEDKRRWNNLGDLWRPENNEGNNMDVWGFYTSKIDGKRKPFKRVLEIGIIDI